MDTGKLFLGTVSTGNRRAMVNLLASGTKIRISPDCNFHGSESLETCHQDFVKICQDRMPPRWCSFRARRLSLRIASCGKQVFGPPGGATLRQSRRNQRPINPAAVGENEKRLCSKTARSDIDDHGAIAPRSACRRRFIVVCRGEVASRDILEERRRHADESEATPTSRDFVISVQRDSARAVSFGA